MAIRTAVEQRRKQVISWRKSQNRTGFHALHNARELVWEKTQSALGLSAVSPSSHSPLPPPSASGVLAFLSFSAHRRMWLISTVPSSLAFRAHRTSRQTQEATVVRILIPSSWLLALRRFFFHAREHNDRERDVGGAGDGGADAYGCDGGFQGSDQRHRDDELFARGDNIESGVDLARLSAARICVQYVDNILN